MEKKGQRRKKKSYYYKRFKCRKGKKWLGKESRKICERTAGSKGKGGNSEINWRRKSMQAKIEDQENKRRIIESKNRLGREEIYIH